jgi:Tat protein secretion system quality control protein TatD with DNase activity
VEKYERLLNMLMDFNGDIIFAAVCDKNGDILWNTKRTNVKNLVPLSDTKKTLQRALNAWKERSKITDKVG